MKFLTSILIVVLLLFNFIHSVEAEIAWNGSNWLICYNNSLIVYNGETFRDITPPEEVLIADSGEHILTKADHDYMLPCGFWFKGRLISLGWGTIGIYNGSSYRVYVSGFGAVSDVKCTRKYCLIVADNKPGGMMVRPELIEYRGELGKNGEPLLQIITSKLKVSMEGKNKSLFDPISIAISHAANESFMIAIWGYLTTYDSEGFPVNETPLSGLVKYNGTDFRVFAELPAGFYPTAIAWNSKYWLLGGQDTTGRKGEIWKYNGTEFVLIYRSDFIPEKIYPVDDFWLIDGKVWLNGTYSHVSVKYAGNKFESLNLTQLKLGYNGIYWLIEGYDSFRKLRLMKYENCKFEDLTDRLKSDLARVKSQKGRTHREEGKITICGPSLILLLSVSGLLLRRYSPVS